MDWAHILIWTEFTENRKCNIERVDENIICKQSKKSSRVKHRKLTERNGT